jgi:hypothetical protein
MIKEQEQREQCVMLCQSHFVPVSIVRHPPATVQVSIVRRSPVSASLSASASHFSAVLRHTRGLRRPSSPPTLSSSKAGEGLRRPSPCAARVAARLLARARVAARLLARARVAARLPARARGLAAMLAPAHSRAAARTSTQQREGQGFSSDWLL